MGSHAFDYSIWEKEPSGKEEKNRHEQRLRQKQKRKKHDDEDEWGEWDD